MTVAPPVPPNFTTQAPSLYKAHLDAGLAAAARLAWGFAPSAEREVSLTPEAVDAAADRFVLERHGFASGDAVRLATGGSLPAPLAAGTDYWVVNAGIETFQLAASPGGAALGLSDGGTGTHTLTRQGDAHVVIGPGPVLNGLGALAEYPARRAPGGAAPVSDPRIDRVVLDPWSGALERIAGIEASLPAAPAIPFNRLPLCRILLPAGASVVTNAMISDERAPPAPVPVRRAALLKLTAPQSIPTNTITKISWQAAVHDDLGLWSAAPNPTRITVPANVRKLRLHLNFSLEGISGGVFDAFHNKNNAGNVQFAGGGLSLAPAPAGNNTTAGFQSGIVDVSAGDFFEFQVRHFSGGARNLRAVNETFLQVEVVE